MTKKTRIEHTTNSIVHVVKPKDDEHCNEIAKIAERIGKRYRFVILKENEPFSSFDQRAYPSSFVLCPKFIVDKSHHNWSKTRFDFYYVNTAKRARKEVVPGGGRQLLTDATPLKTRQMLELLLVFTEIENAEDSTYKRGGRSMESVDSKSRSKYYTTHRVNVTVHQLCRLLESIEVALDEEGVDAKKARKIMEQWEDHILAGSWGRKHEKTKDRPGAGS